MKLVRGNWTWERIWKKTQRNINKSYQHRRTSSVSLLTWFKCYQVSNNQTSQILQKWLSHIRSNLLSTIKSSRTKANHKAKNQHKSSSMNIKTSSIDLSISETLMEYVRYYWVLESMHYRLPHNWEKTLFTS